MHITNLFFCTEKKKFAILIEYLPPSPLNMLKKDMYA